MGRLELGLPAGGRTGLLWMGRSVRSTFCPPIGGLDTSPCPGDTPPLMMSATATPGSLSRREAADYAGVHYNTIRKWEAAGLLTPRRVEVNGVEEVRIDVEQLERVLATRGDSRSQAPRPIGLAHNPEAARLWVAHEQLLERHQKLRERVASLEAENRVLRESIDRIVLATKGR